MLDPEGPTTTTAWRSESGHTCYHNPFRGVNRGVAAAFPVVVPVDAQGVDVSGGFGVLVELTWGDE